MLEPVEPDASNRGAGAFVDRRPRPVLHAQTERHVAEHVAVGEQRVVLEHQTELATVGRHAREVVTVPAHAAGRRTLQPGDRAQQRALPAAAGTEHADDLPVRDRDVDRVQRHRDAVRLGRAGARTSGALPAPLVLHPQLFDLEHQNSPTSRTRSRSMTSTETAVRTIRIVLAAIAWSKLVAPGRPSSR